MTLNEEQKQLARDLGYKPKDELEFLRTVRNIVADIPNKIPENVKLKERGNGYHHQYIRLYYAPDSLRSVVGYYYTRAGIPVFETPSRVKLPLNGLQKIDIKKVGGIIKKSGIISVPIENKDIISMMIRKSIETLPNLLSAGKTKQDKQHTERLGKEKMRRIFHPIGQGAFYTEQFENVNVVYDCGVLPKSGGDKVVRQSFKKNEVIEILFISHFDSDHINKIEILKNHCNIKNVVLPLLYKEERKLLVNIYKALGLEYEAKFVNNPKSCFFKEETNIITVKSSENQKKNPEQEKTITIEDIKRDMKIESKTLIKSKKLPNWVYIPYNYKYNVRNIKLENEIRNNRLDIDKIKNDLNYALKHSKDIQKIYNSLGGDINENSMLLYSGPILLENNERLYDIYSYHFPYFCIRHCHHRQMNRPGCVYTGDSDFNKINIKKIFEHFWDNVGTIQIPHHGSINSFNGNFFDDEFYFCPISVGSNNIHGHPSSSVLAEILHKKALPIVISECPDSRFIQTIM